MTISQVLYSSRSEEWPTPQSFFRLLHEKFGFTLDPCATRDNAKCSTFFTKQQNGLMRSWGKHAGIFPVFGANQPALSPPANPASQMRQAPNLAACPAFRPAI